MKITTKDKQALRDFIGVHTTNIMYNATVDDFELFIIPSDSMQDCKDKADFAKGKIAMTMDVDYEYLRASLTYGLPYTMELWKGKDYQHIIKYICHEVAHIITGEPFDRLKISYRGDGRYYQERVTERTGRLIARLYNGYMKNNNIDLRTGQIKNGKRKKR